MNYIKTTIDTAGALPIDIHAMHGESILLNVELCNYGEPIKTAEQLTCKAYYQDIDTSSPNEWYESDEAVILHENDSTSVEFFWSDKLDGGADAYRYFIRLENGDSISYAIRGNIYLAASPGFVPNEIDFPIQTLDFNAIVVENPPYYKQAEVDKKINSIEKTLEEHAKDIEDIRDAATGGADESLKKHEQNYNNPHKVKVEQLTKKSESAGACGAVWGASSYYKQGEVRFYFDPAMYRKGYVHTTITMPDYMYVDGVEIGGASVDFYGEFVFAEQGNYSGWIFRSTETKNVNGLELYLFVSISVPDLLKKDTSYAVWVGVGTTTNPTDYSHSAEVVTASFDNSTSYSPITNSNYTPSGIYKVLTEEMLRDEKTGLAYTLKVSNGELHLVQYREESF